MYQVEGYAFETKEQEHTAKHEVEIIGYIRKNTRMDDPDIVLALYNNLVLKEIFVTPVGYDFLHRLQHTGERCAAWRRCFAVNGLSRDCWQTLPFRRNCISEVCWPLYREEKNQSGRSWRQSPDTWSPPSDRG